MKLRIAWWNTKLHGVTSRDDGRVGFVADIVERLVRDGQCDAVALCEVPPTLARRLRPNGDPRTAVDVHHDDLDERHPHDLALMVRRELVKAVLRQDCRERETGSAHHAGVIFELVLAGAGPLHLALCHWPAVGMGDQDHIPASHAHCALMIRQAFRKSDEGEVGFVALGDFNEEPFHPAIRDTLMGTRDLERARDRGRCLYNVGWRWLARQRPFDGRAHEEAIAGTHLYRNGVESRWRTYDQALVSPKLLRGVGWTLREDETVIWYDDALRGARGALLHRYADHLPLVVTLEYIPPDEEKR